MVRTVPSDLLAAAKASDDWAFEALLDPVIDPAFRLAWGMLHDRQAAEDAVRKRRCSPGESCPASAGCISELGYDAVGR